jgi:hypothetical protein
LRREDGDSVAGCALDEGGNIGGGRFGHVVAGCRLTEGGEELLEPGGADDDEAAGLGAIGVEACGIPRGRNTNCPAPAVTVSLPITARMRPSST